MKKCLVLSVLCVVLAVGLVSSPSLGQQSLVGTYNLLSLVVEVDGNPTPAMGKAPNGYLVFTPTRFIILITGENRKFGTSEADKAALFDTLASYAGTYRIEGDKIMMTPEISWTQNNVGKTDVETFEVSGKRLTMTVGPIPFPRDPSKKLIRRETWEKVE